MLWFDDCRKRGLFNSTKRRDYGPVWAEVVARCREEWPEYHWEEKVVRTKYDTEQRRFRLWKALMEYSGVSLDPDTGLPVASDATWEQFVARYATKNRSVQWLRIQPLGDISVYESVFFRERATGSFIVEVDDIVDGTQASILDDFGDSGRDDPDLLDIDSGDDEAVRLSPTRRRRLTASQRRRQEIDPDQTPETESLPGVDVPARTTRKRNNRQSDIVALAGSLQTAATALATAQTAAPQLPGTDAIAKAVSDIQQRFKDELPEEELVNCLRYLQNNPMGAVIWNGLDDSVKPGFLEGWKRG